MSLFTMSLLLPIITKIRWNVFIIFCLSLICGFSSEFGAFLSISRTICFLPYFLLGYYCPESFFESIKKRKLIIFLVTFVITILLYFYFISQYGLSHIEGTVLTLHRSTAYENMEIGRLIGLLFRIITIPLSIIYGIFVLTYIPKTQTILSFFGKASLIIFIFHSYFVRLFWKIIKVNENSLWGGATLIISSILITIFLSIPLFEKIYRKCMKTIEGIIFKV
jgi:fucose 4-O-acetylase-like acetyltransferase